MRFCGSVTFEKKWGVLGEREIGRGVVRDDLQIDSHFLLYAT